MGRTILHSDANCFYASVEMLLNPAFRNVPLAVCGSTEERHGIVLAKNDLAKKAGVKTGSANWEAREACPGLVTVPPHYDEYVKFSRLLRNIYRRYTDALEPFGMDECWLDVTEILYKYGSGEAVANEIRETVKEELGITVSVGVSFNKIFAKLGSDMKKTDAVTVLDESNWRERVWPLPVNELLYVGNATARKLISRGIYTIGDLAAVPVEMIHSWLGKNGVMIWLFARGEDTSRVMPDGYEIPVKTVGHGITCSRDLNAGEEVWRVILELSQDIGHRLREYELCARGVRLTVRGSTLAFEQYQTPLPLPSQSPMEIARSARALFEKRFHWNDTVRAVTVTAIDLMPENPPIQLDLFGRADRSMKRQKLEDSIDVIRGRFGKNAVVNASLLTNLPIPDDGRDLVSMPNIMFS